ncbi:hypothetical protein [Noviherbaspirillum pedocola]|uniref:Uncharacterized protein n=1 Tax=Noviherbaspirillum pedocola TaxID=2801341 RepID=A0A934SQF0_9BURK|nr:hypothetical protein [Noviherbaspirillum pedocola]MBK4733221.1 hypothetical protein [Noviherbaspirillum pedocola]
MADLNLGYLGDFAAKALGNAQTTLTEQLEKLSSSGSGSGLDILAMSKVQIQISAFSLIGQLISAVTKDVSDTMKGAVRNIN